ncbi:MAG: glycosyltransferase, partial [Lachnospiraceae bacterium]|nr:glycosyltransferase [Lachnospiraceae bacterium]
MSGRYQISIVTPFHNTDMSMFQRCADSMKEQTLGFKNIEWIVVVHNSDDEHLNAVRDILNGYENVSIEVLNNDIHSPSSPRNLGLKLATADYVGFLDSDDGFTPVALRDALRHLKDSKAQIGWFRREYELEKEDNLPITEIVLWDQTREEIIVTRESWDDEKMFSGICGMVTSRIYDRDFLSSNGICFDEEVPFGEDYLFNLEAYGHAEKICYMPQLIGYHYYINSKSLVQGGSGMDAKTLTAYAQGYKKIFDTGLKYGFFMNAIIGGLACVLARFLVIADNISLDDRIKIKEIMEPYLEIMTPLKVSKLYSEKDVKNRYDFPRDVILHPEKYTGNSDEALIDINIRDARPLSEYR